MVPRRRRRRAAALRGDLGVALPRGRRRAARAGRGRGRHGALALAHVYTLVDADTAILLFSVFLVVLALGMVVAGVALARVWRGPARFVPLVCGVWPLATIPAGAALGDLPHFGAIAVWGLCWVAFGALTRSR